MRKVYEKVEKKLVFWFLCQIKACQKKSFLVKINSRRKNKEVGASTVNGTINPQNDEIRWNQKYKELVQFKLENGHTVIEKTDEAHRELYIWANEQRRLFQKGTMEELNRSMLNMLEFNWYTSEEEKRWNDNYLLLKDCQELIGTVNFQFIDEEDERFELSEWANQQRLLFQQGQLEEDKEKKLLELGFDFNYINLRRKKSIIPYLKRPICEEWMIYFNRLKTYYLAHEGDLDFLKAEDNKIFRWLKRELRNYNRGVLSYRKIELFSEIGFDFEAAGEFYKLKEKSKKEISPSAALIKTSKQVHSRWFTNYHHFSILYQQNNKYLASLYYHDEQMYKWFKRQVKLYQDDCLSNDKVKLFEKIGINLDEHKSLVQK